MVRQYSRTAKLRISIDLLVSNRYYGNEILIMTKWFEYYTIALFLRVPRRRDYTKVLNEK